MAIATVVQRSDAVTVSCACTGGTSSLRCRWSCLQCSITRTAPYKDRAQPPGSRSGGASRTTQRRPRTPPLFSRSSSASSRKSPAECDQGRSRILRRRRGLSGTSWSTGLKRVPSCRSSMLLCRRVGTSCGSVPVPRFARPRAGYRSAQDLLFTPTFSQAPGSLGADGGTVGGSGGIRAVGRSVPAADG